MRRDGRRPGRGAGESCDDHRLVECIERSERLYVLCCSVDVPYRPLLERRSDLCVRALVVLQTTVRRQNKSNNLFVTSARQSSIHPHGAQWHTLPVSRPPAVSAVVRACGHSAPAVVPANRGRRRSSRRRRHLRSASRALPAARRGPRAPTDWPRLAQAVVSQCGVRAAQQDTQQSSARRGRAQQRPAARRAVRRQITDKNGGGGPRPLPSSTADRRRAPLVAGQPRASAAGPLAAGSSVLSCLSSS